jgi:hypothetical protein
MRKGNVNNRFMRVFCGNSDTMTDPPRAELLRKQNPNLNEMKKIGFRNDRHVVTSEGKLAVGVDGRDDCSSGALPLPLGRHRDFSGRASGLENLGEAEERMKRKSEARARKSKRHVGVSINGSNVLGSGTISKVSDHYSEKQKPQASPAVTSKMLAVSGTWTNYQTCKQKSNKKQ